MSEDEEPGRPQGYAPTVLRGKRSSSLSCMVGAHPCGRPGWWSPEFLAIGHVTRDVRPDGGFSLGGTVTFSALTASRLGLTAAIVTRADAELLAELPARLPNIAVAARPSPATTTFANQYQAGFRTQYLRARAESVEIEDIPLAWHTSPIVLFGPLDQELTPTMVRHFPRRQGAIIAATPQGWLRRWDTDGQVWPTRWTGAEEVLPLLDVLVLSHEDLLPFADGKRADADALLKQWSLQVPLLVATDGRKGATLFEYGETTEFPAYAATEVDPTGAGDVFVAAFLVHLSRHAEPHKAVDFANCVASLSIEHEGTSGIPVMGRVEERMKSEPHAKHPR